MGRINNTMAPVLAYWNIRGLAQPIRLLLEYTGTEFEDKMYECGPAPDYDKSCWFDIKFDLGMDFPNLPYYIDGDLKITQSNAIIRHIARKHDMCGKTEEEKVRVDVLENQAVDMSRALTQLCYREYDTKKDAYLEALKKTLKQYSDCLGERKWFAGDNLTYIDFIMYELLDKHLILESTCLKDTKNLEEFHKRFEELEAIKKYMASPRFMKGPLNNKMAKFGNK